MSIPTVNLKRATSPATRPQALQEVRHALLDVGFLYLSDHGIPESMTRELVEMLPVLFALPAEVKESVALVRSPHFLGYSKFGSETTARLQDQREQFELANELVDKYAASTENNPLYIRLQGPNQWLSDEVLPRFRAVVESYVAALQDVAHRFLDVVTEALELPAGSLTGFTGPQDRIKLAHYRSTAVPSNDGQASVQGVGPHKDSSGWMTFLLQASETIGGLQALSKDGEWLDVPPVPGTLVVNMGQAFEVVTNGVCKATTHRVVLPPSQTYDRYSVPFFQGVRPDLTKRDLGRLWEHFDPVKWNTRESEEGRLVDSPFLRGRYETWGEAQLRTKIRSHRDVGKRHYPEVFESYINDD